MKIPLKTPIMLFVRIIGRNGLRERLSVLDTGATYTSIPWEDVIQLGYDPFAAEKRVPIITADGIIEAPLIVINKIKIGELTAENVEAIVHDLPEQSAVNVLLGVSFLKNFVTTIDYKNNILIIEDP